MSHRGVSSIRVISLNRMGRSQTLVVAMVAPLALLLAACGSTPSAAPAKASTTSTSIHKAAKVAPVAKVKAHPSTTTTVASTTTRPVGTSGSSGSSAPTPNYTPPTTPYVPPTTAPPPPPTSRCADSNPPSGCSVTADSFVACQVTTEPMSVTISYTYSDGSVSAIPMTYTGTSMYLTTDSHGWQLPTVLVIDHNPSDPSLDRCGTA